MDLLWIIPSDVFLPLLHVENALFNQDTKHKIYNRYADYIFIFAKNKQEIGNLNTTFGKKNCS